MPFGVVVNHVSSGIASVSIVGGRFCTTDDGSPAEKMMLPLGALRSVLWSSVAVKESCVCLASA